MGNKLKFKIEDVYFDCHKLEISRNLSRNDKNEDIYTCRLSKGAIKHVKPNDCKLCTQSSVWFKEPKKIWHNNVIEVD